MSWKLRLHENQPLPIHIGDCWMIPPDDIERRIKLGLMSNEFKAGKSLALMVVLPGINLFLLSQRPTSGTAGWVVTGTAPVITVMPSINCVGSFHGFITNGEITEDCEGRKFDANGFPVKPIDSAARNG